MPTPLPPASAPPAPCSSLLPLQGLTVLAVEDSRFACEALRLMCHRSGARLRRAESLAAARSHLAVYRPDVVIVDLGLPDGRGEGLIRRLALAPSPGPGIAAPVVIGMSGDLAGRGLAMMAGAAGFLEKPIERLGQFQACLLRHLPDRRGNGTSDEGCPPLRPDSMALHDDLTRAETITARLLASRSGGATQRYLAGFVSGIARHAHDPVLEAAAHAVEDGSGMDRLGLLLRARLASTDDPFLRRSGD